jgi:starch synthase
VVAVAEGGVPESVAHGETGLLTSRDADAFAVAVGRVLGEPGPAERLGQGGAARARSQYAWSRTVEQVEGQLLEMAQGVAVR